MNAPAPATCALCDATTRTAFHIAARVADPTPGGSAGYDVLQCVRCGHRQLDLQLLSEHSAHVAATYGDDYFSGGGAGYPDYLAEGAMLRTRGRRYGDILRRYAPSAGSVLDVGAAAGFVAAGLADAGWRATGVEPNDAMAAYGRRELGLDLRTGTFEGVRFAERFDAVTMIQVVAHFVDPAAAIAKAASLVAPNGMVLIETWDRNSRTARLFGKRWHEYSPPSVVHWFTKAELRTLAAEHDLAHVATGRMIKWIDGAHAASLVRHRSPALGRVAGVVPSRLRIPYPSEDLFWMLFRERKGGATHEGGQ